MNNVVSFVDQVRPKKETLTIVGSGIAGIMTAWESSKAGYGTTVISQSPDPRLRSDNDNPKFSSTFDSKNDQRYITLFEGHPYLELAGYIDKMYPDIADDFTKHVLNGGLLVVPFEQFKEESKQWLNDRLGINQALKNRDQDAIDRATALFENYEQENRTAMEKWYDFLQNILAQKPNLLDSLSLSHKGIIRLYDNEGVFTQAEESHKRGGVFKRRLTPQELANKYPAYAKGVENGFIQGGAIEMHGLTLGIKSLGEAMIDILEEKGVTFRFNKPVEKIVVESGEVQGIRLTGDANLHTSKHYMVHPGAFSKPSLFEDIAEAQSQLAAMEGYWITIEGADEIVTKMGNKPNKVHGKQTLATLLARLPEDSSERYTRTFSELRIDKNELAEIAPIVDFNNMPIWRDKGVTLGVGSGYVFKGLAYSDENGKPDFVTDGRSEAFVLTVMELWLEVLHGRELLDSGTLVAHSIGCKRSWTMDDKEMDINYPTKDGGVLGIRGGGNTGDTTKSTFIAAYNVNLMQAVDGQSAGAERPDVNELGNNLRTALRKTATDLKPLDWEQKTRALGNTIQRATALNAISRRSGRAESENNHLKGR